RTSKRDTSKADTRALDALKHSDIPKGTIKSAGLKGRRLHELVAIWGNSPEKSKRGCTAIAFSPDGKLLACGERQGSIRLIEAATGKLRKTFSKGGHSSEIRHLAFSSGGGTLASSARDGKVCLWSLATG